MRYTLGMHPNNKEVMELLGSIYPFHRKAGMDYVMLKLVCDNLKIFEFHGGEVIYEPGHRAEALYIVFSGEVHLLREDLNSNDVIVRLGRGDYFGFEVLEENSYQAKAIAALDTIVLILYRDALIRLASEIHEFNLGLRLMYDSYRTAQRVHLDWITPDEVIYFIGRRHIAFLFLRLLIPLFALGFFTLLFAALSWLKVLSGHMAMIAPIAALVGALLWMVWEYLDWANDYSIITSKRVLFQERIILLYESCQEEPMTAILSVSTFSSQIGRWLGFGDVIVYTYAGQVRLPALKDFEQVKFLLEATIQRSGIKLKQLGKEDIEKLIQERITHFKPEVPNETIIQPREQPGVVHQFVQQYFSNLLRMRYVYGNIVVYRKH